MLEQLSKLSDNQKYDPWEIKQNIEEVRVVTHCCRYWMLSEWECENMSFPFWRLYHSSTGGSYVEFDDIEFHLSNETLILIPPNTSFNTHIKKNRFSKHESIVGQKIKNEKEILFLQNKGLCDQLFIHFNLGYPFDSIKPAIYAIKVNDYCFELIRQIKSNMLITPNDISIQSNFKIKSLILFGLQNISDILWEFPTIDKRILKIINYIDKNISKKLSNNDLSNVSNLATNSFARLFRESIHCSVQKYIQRRKIEHAIMLLHHTNMQIEDIALECGFYDRHHFSKIFKIQTGIPPVKYRLKIGM